MGGDTDDSDESPVVGTVGDEAGDDSPAASHGGAETTEEGDGSGSGEWSVFERYDSLTLPRVVVAIALVAVILRVLTLGSRSAHWDEARVAYWSYFYTDTGSLAYYWEEHGPFVQITAARLFAVFGVTDFAARLPVAVVGGLLPLGSLLFREHLRRSETIALALFLSLNAILLYYSRFMRSDVLVAAFLFVGLGLLVRFLDTRKARYLLAAGLVIGLGFGSKENAVVYVLTWLGAGALVVDQYLHSPASAESGFDRIRSNLDYYRERARAAVFRLDYAIGFLLTFLLTLVVVFAPRGQGLDRRLYADPDANPVTLSSAIRNPTELPALVDGALGEAYSGYLDWFAQSDETTFDQYVSFFTDYVTLLVEYAPLLVAFTVVGIVVERYGRDQARALVMFMAYCGVASLVGYPLGSHIQGDSAWLSVHVIVPLTIPAAVGLAWAYRRGRDILRERSLNPLVVLVVVLLLVGLWAWFVPVQSVYVEDTAEDNRLSQFAQPNTDLNPLVETMSEIETDGPAVTVYYGEQGESYDQRDSLIIQDPTGEFAGQWQIEPRCSDWGTIQPLNWYFAVADTTVGCERDAESLAAGAAAGEIPMVITSPEDTTVPQELQEDPYVERSVYLRNVGGEVVVYIHSDWVE